MSTDMILNTNQPLAVPAYLQGANLGVSANLLATAGAGGNRIGLKGNRFRIVLNGKEETIIEENYLDVIIVGAVPHVSRIFYEGAYDQDTKTPPTCYSADGNAPADDVKQKQAVRCDICKQNQKGSKIVGGVKIKACGFFQRLVVMLPGDPTLYRLDTKAMGLFGTSQPQANKYNLQEYSKLVSNRGVDVGALITRLSFDVDSSVPKLMFAAKGFITADDYAMVAEKVGSPELERMLTIDMQTVDISGEASDDDKPQATQATQTRPAQQARPQPVQEAPQVQEVPVELDEPKPQATPAANPAIHTTAKGTQIRLTKKALDDGYTFEDFFANEWDATGLVKEGWAEIVAPAPKPAPPKPAAAPPKPTAPPKPAAPARPSAPAAPAAKAVPGRPAVVKAAPPPAEDTVVTTSSDSEIDDIISSLD